MITIMIVIISIITSFRFLLPFFSPLNMSDDESPAFVADEWWQTHHGNGIPEDDSNGVCVISYSPEYVTGMNLFRSVVAKKDVSPQVLPLLSHLISLNPGNYSVWHYRRILLAALVTSHDPLVYQKELQYVSDMAEEHPKNYQIWYHRQAVVSLLFSGGDAAKAQEDLDFVAKVFEEDAKNYHAWTYRQWVIARSNLWEQELAFTDELIAKDVRNNSAWTQRHFVFTKGPKTFADPAILASEIRHDPFSPLPLSLQIPNPPFPVPFFSFSYTTSKIQRSPNNESAWNYLRG